MSCVLSMTFCSLQKASINYLGNLKFLWNLSFLKKCPAVLFKHSLSLLYSLGFSKRKHDLGHEFGPCIWGIKYTHVHTHTHSYAHTHIQKARIPRNAQEYIKTLCWADLRHRTWPANVWWSNAWSQSSKTGKVYVFSKTQFSAKDQKAYKETEKNKKSILK